ncbi:MAG: tetratricopeptide repeat protein [Phaeodactylibacter sp.]|nr:tetratricopeptide repeat protein [Phaeodactylibacter sp.]MCB9299116.1 tetratricopeptide repeat protein [Lewinellaceae bacterium]HQU61156.1 hypothetical protein [Saprospiraceae bacterium]
MAKGKSKNKFGLGLPDKDWSIINRIIESQEFQNLEELQAFLNKNIVGKTPEQLAAEFPMEKADAQKAQDLVYEAMEVRSAAKARKLVEQALKLDPDCVEAYEFKGDNSLTPEEALKWYQEGMDATRRRMGEAAFEAAKGHFWGVHETRPFMRCKQQSAFAHYALGQVEAAIHHLEEMLRLNPNDNQGIRYTLFDWLLIARRYKDAARLHRRFAGDMFAGWQYGYAILLFKTKGDTVKARNALEEAIDANPHVIEILTGALEIPDELPDYYSPGDENEAISYIASAHPLYTQDIKISQWIIKTLERLE